MSAITDDPEFQTKYASMGRILPGLLSDLPTLPPGQQDITVETLLTAVIDMYSQDREFEIKHNGEEGDKPMVHALARIQALVDTTKQLGYLSPRESQAEVPENTPDEVEL